MENLSTMRTEILSLYSRPGGSVAVQKSQLVSLTAKEILDTADSSFGQMHTLVACLEARAFFHLYKGKSENPADMLLQHTKLGAHMKASLGWQAMIEKTEQDVEHCQRLRLHHAVEPGQNYGSLWVDKIIMKPHETLATLNP